jgi:putative ABC transport system ATP-binding protein
MSPVEVQAVVKRFRQGQSQVLALDGVTLSVAQGTFLAVMGASGSGKSTLLHLMAGLSVPDSGSVLVNGRDLGKMPDRELTLFRRHHIGLVFQSFNLIPTLSAEENIGLPLMLEGVNGRAGSVKVDALLKSLGLLDRRSHRPDALSGGEQQRVAIGRALVSEPAVILADEPTGNLDADTGRSVCQLLRDLSVAGGKTIVMVTHEPNVAAFAREVVVLKSGKIAGRFTTEEAGSAAGLAMRYQDCLAAGTGAGS